MFLESYNVREAIIKFIDKPVKYKDIVLLFGAIVLAFEM